MHSGPIWDYDNSSGNTSNLAAKDPHRLWAATRNNWYAGLPEYPEFRQLVGDELERCEGIIRETIDDRVDYVAEHGYDFKHNFLDKWSILGSRVCSNPAEFMVLTEWMEHVQYLRNWLFASLDASIDTYCEA